MFFKWLGLIGLAVSVFGLTYTYNKRFLDWLRFQSLGTRDYIAEKLSLMFIEIPPHQILLGQFIVSFGLGFLVLLFALPNVVAGLFFGALVTIGGWKAPKPIVDFMYARRIEKFTLQMVDGLGLMSNGLKSGLSVVQALGLVVQEMPNPIKQEFNLLLSQNKLGVPLEDAFVELSKRIKSDDVEMFVTAVNILKETGGNLAETFDTIVSTIRERVKVEGKIQALTRQGMIQGYVIMAVPPAIGLFFYSTDPAFMQPMVSTPLGLLILGGVVVLEIIGFVVINKIIKIEV